MRRFLLYVGLLVIFLIPLNISAINISGSSVNGVSSVAVGEDFSVNFNVNFSDMNMCNRTEVGMVGLAFELIFDPNVLSVSGISAPNFTSEVVNDGNEYVVVSTILDDSDTLYCGNYTSNINFTVKNTTSVNTSIQIGEIKGYFIDINSISGELTEDDLIIISSHSNNTHNVTINHTTNEPVVNAKDITTTGSGSKNKIKKEVSEITTSINEETKSNKSSNALLSSLEIIDYELHFDKYTNDYTIEITSDINSLNIKASTEDGKASYKIIGADDLKANNYQVLVEVTAEDLTKNTYTLNIKVKEDKKINKNIKEKVRGNSKKTKKIDKRIFIWGGIGLVIIIIVSIIAFIISKRRDRDIDQFLDKV